MCFLRCVQEIKAVGNELNITPTIIRGQELKQKGFGGKLWNTVPATERPFKQSNLCALQSGLNISLNKIKWATF